MDDFIKQVSSSTGVDESQAKSFIAQILEFIKSNASEDVTKDISENVPGAAQLVSEEAGSTKTNDLLTPCMPVLEMLKKLLDQVFGGDASKVAEVSEIMTKSGVSPQQDVNMISKLLEFLKGKVGPETFN